MKIAPKFTKQKKINITKNFKKQASHIFAMIYNFGSALGIFFPEISGCHAVIFPE